MNELKILVESIAGLPDLAIWVVAMYFFFKIVVVGSIFGVIRYITMKLHNWAITKKTEPEVSVNVVEKIIEPIRIGSVLIDADKGVGINLIRILKKLRTDNLVFVHESHLQELEDVVDRVILERKQ